jgi:deoxycytidylate deaminase
MKIIKNPSDEIILWLNKAKEIAQRATCMRAKCGAVIVKDSVIIGKGFNSPPGENESERRCNIEKNKYHVKVTDKTCCMHAEQRAVMDALAHYPGHIKGSRLFFVGLLPSGELRTDHGEIRLYCTICTKMMRDVGIEEFILMSKDGCVLFSAPEYITYSYEYSTGFQ